MPGKKLLIACLIALAFAGCKGNKSVSAPQFPFDKFLEQYQDERMRVFPLEATDFGDNRFNDLLPNTISQPYIDTMQEFFQRYTEQLNSYDRASLNHEEQMSYDILKWDLQVSLESFKFKDYLVPINQMWSLPLTFGQLGSGQGTQPFKTVKDYEDFLKRMEGFKAWCDTAVENMKKGIALGYTNPKLLMEKTLPQIQSMVVSDVTQSLFYMPVKNFPADFSESDKSHLDSLYKKAISGLIIPSYKKLYDFIRNEYIPKCRTTDGISALPDGKEYYSYLVKYWTTTNLTPEEIFAIGEKEVQRIHGEMEKVKEQVGFTGDLKSFFVYLNTDRKFFPFKTPQEVLDSFEAIHVRMAPQLRKLFIEIPKTPFEIRETEKFREASASPEYQGGTADGKRPGIFYVPIPDVKKFSTFGMEDIFLHEAIPGHHFQVSLQRENKSLPAFRKSIWYGAYGEGWALYTESLGKELGLYTDPYQYMGNLSWEMHRALRLVIDVGIHTKGWTRAQAISYSLENEGKSEQEIIAEVERYMAIPGQALSYKMGQMRILELRARAEKELGKKFDAARFHKAVLEDGCLPLSVLEKKITDWIKEQ
jgi:uncharacterized protein (DUF885 family)